MSGRHKRSLKNYLLDPHFQLKYTGYLVLIAVLLSVALGFVLWRTSDAVLAQSEKSVSLGEQVVKRGRDVVDESKKVSQVVKMNIVKDPDYKDNPALLEVFEADAKGQDERLSQQQRDLEDQAKALRAQSDELASQRRTMSYALIGVLVALVVFIGLAGIVVTHRVAGPIFKMKRQLREVGSGHLRVPSALRKGDELVHFFETFADMVRGLRERQEREIALLDDAIVRLEGKAQEGDLEPLRKLREEMQGALET
ncbi:MAG: HAMP domain-containing protein [Polyangiaceae bacterium]|nr:HAMP domain-containing protein [Polyangiaceae bacterium]MCW5791766.1 HAMP domain-containing protein [Polyangiaceae bacterium]